MEGIRNGRITDGKKYQTSPTTGGEVERTIFIMDLIRRERVCQGAE